MTAWSKESFPHLDLDAGSTGSFREAKKEPFRSPVDPLPEVGNPDGIREAAGGERQAPLNIMSTL